MSAYVIDSKKYQEFESILNALASNAQLASILHPVEVYARTHITGGRIDYNASTFELRKQATSAFAEDMIRLNYASVGYRYNTDQETPEEFMPVWKPADIRFIAYGKPADYLQLASFIDCWDYQSCELPDRQMTEQYKALTLACEQLKANLLQKGLEQATHSEGSWGHLEMSYHKPALKVV